MAWRNLWRNPRRTILTVAAIAFACLLLIFMLSWQFGSYEAMINAAVKIHTGHLQVQAKGYQEKQGIRQVVPDPKAVAAILQKAPGVAHYTFRSDAFSLVSSKQRTYGVLVVGIQPEKEAQVSTLKKIISQGSYLAAGDKDGALLGHLLAKNLQVGLGDEVTVLGQGRDGSIAATVLKVKGIYQSGMDQFDRSSLQISLKNFDDTYAMMGAVHEVVAICQSLDEVHQAKEFVAAKLAGLPPKHPLVALDWNQLMPGLLQGIKIDMISGLIFYCLLLLVVAFSILNTFLMSIFERMHEFGVLMALGTTPGRLTKLVLLESIALTLVGVAAGLVLGCAVTWYFQNQGIALTGASDILRQYGLPHRMYPQLSLLSACLGPAAVLAITFLTALYPALKIRRLSPLKALSYV
jgi:ABC-type lipoprotein release transport system permease subunit